MKLSEAHRIICENEIENNTTSPEKTVKVYFDDSIVAKDCFDGLAAEADDVNGPIIEVYGCEIKNADNFIIIHALNGNTVDEIANKIIDAYAEYEPYVEEITNESANDIVNVGCFEYLM